jgi:hypothetical protein
LLNNSAERMGMRANFRVSNLAEESHAVNARFQDERHRARVPRIVSRTESEVDESSATPF